MRECVYLTILEENGSNMFGMNENLDLEFCNVDS